MLANRTLLATILVLGLTGCNPFAQRSQDRITVVHTTTKSLRVVEMVIILESVELPIFIKNNDGTLQEKKNLLNWSATRPDIAKVQGLIAPRIVVNQVVRVLREDGKEDRIDLGGWYVEPPKDPPPK